MCLVSPGEVMSSFIRSATFPLVPLINHSGSIHRADSRHIHVFLKLVINKSVITGPGGGGGARL